MAKALDAMEGVSVSKLIQVAEAAATVDEVTQAKAEKADKDALDNFAGLGLGAGLSITFDSGSDRVTEAELVNGIVRVSDEDNAVPRLMLEGHYFFLPKGSFLGMVPTRRWGWGPFVAIESSDNKVIDAIGFGLMLGFRTATDTQSFNIGLGYVVDPDVKKLGDGIRANEPLPVGETTVRYKEEAEGGIVLVFSFDWN